MEANASLTQIFTLLASKSWLQICCPAGDTFFYDKNRCILDVGNDPAELISKSFANCTSYVFLNSTDLAAEKIAATSGQLRKNVTLCAKNSTKYVCIWLDYNCFDFVREQNKSKPLHEPDSMQTDGFLGFLIHFFSLLSLLLAIVTLALFLGLSVLRKRVYDKCFICYLITLTVMLIFAYVFKILWNTADDDEVEEILFNLIFVSVILWLNGMCIKLWRSVRSIKPIPVVKLLYFALYAWGFPLILAVMNIIGCKIYEDSEFILEIEYYFNLLIVVFILIINFVLVFHVAIIIWQQKKRCKGNTEFRCTRHIRQHKQRLFIIIKLFFIMGLVGANHFYFHKYYKTSSGIYKYTSKFIIMCPGFAIFIIFVGCNTKLISELKRRFIMQSDIRENRLQNVQYPNVGSEIAETNFIEAES